MDRETPENVNASSSNSKQDRDISASSPTLTQNVEDLIPEPLIEPVNASTTDVNASSNFQAISAQLPESFESEHTEKSTAHSLHNSIEQTSLPCHKECHFDTPELQTPVIKEQYISPQTNTQNHPAPSFSDSNSVSDIFEQIGITNLSAGDIVHPTETGGTQSLSLVSDNALLLPLSDTNFVDPQKPILDITKSIQDRKCENEETENVSSRTPSHDIPSESSDTCHRKSSLDINVVQLPETCTTVPDSEEPAATTAAYDDLAAAAAAMGSYHESVYYIKWVMFGQSSVPIITQNENGPCPLIAIMNVLLLKEKVKLAPMLEMITSEQLMTYLGECIFDNMPQNLPATTQANYEQNMQDAMSVMYKLQTGLDVNVKFTGVGEFEYTRELIIFDLLEISLYHGWLVDPQDSDTVAAIHHCSYNQLVEKIICLRQSEEENSVRQALIAEQFLERTASQLTYHGLCELSSLVKEKELCVFFRNNHFNTLYKFNNELFLLMTDQGFLTESNVVWQTLSNVDGDCHFTDATFRTYTKPVPSTVPITDPSIAVGSPEQIDHDYQVALFLQEEDASLQKQTWRSDLEQEQTAHSLTDHELALCLQEEEDRKLAEESEKRVSGSNVLDSISQQQQRQSRPPNQGPAAEGQRRRQDRSDRREKEEKGCSVL